MAKKDTVKEKKGAAVIIQGDNDITLRLIGKMEITLNISDQWTNNFYLFKLSVPAQMKAPHEMHVV